MMGRSIKKGMTPEERVKNALIPKEEQPYVVPDNWKWVNIGSVCSFIGGGTPSKDNDVYWNGNIPWASVKDIKGDYLYSTIDHITLEGLNNSSANVCDIDDLILVTRIEPAKTTIAKIRSAINQDLKIVKSPVFTPYIHYYFRTFQHVFEIKASGSTVKGITIPNVENGAFPLPPSAEQHRIVDRIESLFAKLDEAKEKAQAVVDGYEDRKAAILHKAFTGELTTVWRSESGINNSSWKTVVLSDVCKVNPPKAATKDLPDDLEVSFYPMPALSEVYGEITEPQTRRLSEVRSGFTNFVEGDIVFAKITPCMENGKSAVIGKLVNGIGFGTTEFFVIRCSDKIINRFLWHMIRDISFRNKAKAVMTGAVGQQRVPKSFLEEYQIQLPSVEEQKRIVQLLDDALKTDLIAIEHADKVIQQIEMTKKAILARAFRGELGTNDPTEEPVDIGTL